MTQHLLGKSAVVTGSSMGIGRAVAIELARQGARVVINGSSDATALNETVEMIRRGGGQAEGVLGSVTDFEIAGQLVARCTTVFGGIDILVNAAGIAEPLGANILNMPLDAWKRQIDVHLHGTFNTCRHAAPLMAERGRGAIINCASHGMTGIYGGTGYAAGKGGTLSLTWALAKDLEEQGITCNVICPGAETRLSTGPDYEASIKSLHQRGLLSDMMMHASLNPVPPKFLAPAFAFLASDMARHITGKVFSVSGGYVGIFSGLEERMLAYKDHKDGSTWSLDELQEQLSKAEL